MTIPITDTVFTTRNDTLDFRNTLDGLLVVGRVCHCTRIDYTAGVRDLLGKSMFYTDTDGVEREVCSWTLRLNPEETRVIMYRNVTASDEQFPAIEFEAEDDATAAGRQSIRTTIFQAVNEIRVRGGIVAGPDDAQAIMDMLETNYPDP